MRGLAIAIGLGFATLGVTSSALADAPSKEDVAKADVLFRDAQAAVQKGNLAEGCVKFAESQKLDPANGTLLNLALCHEKDGKTATAYKELQELVAIMSGSKSPDDKERTRVATARIKNLEKVVPKVSFDMALVPKESSLTLDGEKIADPSFPTLVDPGSHTVVVTAPKKKEGKKTFDVKEPITSVKLDPLEDDAPPPQAAPPPAPKPPPPPPPSNFWTGTRVAGAAIIGVGLIGVGVGSYFGLDTFSKRDERDAQCQGTVCNADGIRLHDDATTSATISSIAFIAGGVAIAGGIVLMVMGGPEAPAKASISVGANGAVLRGSF